MRFWSDNAFFKNFSRVVCSRPKKLVLTILTNSLLTSQGAHQAGAYLGFSSTKQLGVFLLPPGWEAYPSQGYPYYVHRYPFTHLGGERHCMSKVPCPRKKVKVKSACESSGPLGRSLSRFL